MSFKIHINYLDGGLVHAGVDIDGSEHYMCEAESGTVHSIKGYLEIRLNEGVPRTSESIRAVVRDAYAQFGTLVDGGGRHIHTSTGSFDLFYRDGLPATSEQAVAELRAYIQRIITERGARHLQALIGAN
jgi:hypothetical protein